MTCGGILTLRDWLSLYGQESCSGCVYNQPIKAHCLYKGRNYCARYEGYLKDAKKPQPTLFDDED